MSTYHGRGGVVRDGTNNIGKIQNWEFEESAETAATDSMGDTHRTRVIDLIDATGAVTFVYDDADTGQNALGVGQALTLELYPAGNVSGKTYWTIPCWVTRIGRPQVKDQAVIFSFNWELNGVITEAVVTP